MDLITHFSRYIAAPLYHLKNKDRLFKYLRELERMQWMPIEKLKSFQMAKLKKLLIHAYETVDFYRQRFDKAKFVPYNFQNTMELQKIPILTKKDIIENQKRMVSNKYHIQNLVKSCTGGSTGTQLHFYIDQESVNQKNACAWRHNRWANWNIGMPVAALWGNPPIADNLKSKIRKTILERFIYLDTINITPHTMIDFIKKINRLDHYILYGHSHSQYIFAKFIKDNMFIVKRPIGIVSTSMMLLKNERKVIEEVFDQNVTDRYGCEEVSLIGCECEKHNGMHLNINHLNVEFITTDNEIAQAGDEGRIIVTDLTNFGMPFIRYEVGDVGIPTDQRCSCGRQLPLMQQVTGRTADFLYRKDGSQVAGVSLIERWLTNIEGIYQMQIVQNQLDSLSINIVKDNHFSIKKTIDPLKKEFNKVFIGSKMNIDFLEKIPPEKSGKYRFSICNIEK